MVSDVAKVEVKPRKGWHTVGGGCVVPGRGTYSGCAGR